MFCSLLLWLQRETYLCNLINSAMIRKIERGGFPLSITVPATPLKALDFLFINGLEVRFPCTRNSVVSFTPSPLAAKMSELNNGTIFQVTQVMCYYFLSSKNVNLRLMKLNMKFFFFKIAWLKEIFLILEILNFLKCIEYILLSNKSKLFMLRNYDFILWLWIIVLYYSCINFF